jgi:hypothetical protein
MPFWMRSNPTNLTFLKKEKMFIFDFEVKSCINQVQRVSGESLAKWETAVRLI